MYIRHFKKKCSYADSSSLKKPLENNVYAMYIRHFKKSIESIEFEKIRFFGSPEN